MAPAINKNTIANIESKLVVTGGERWTGTLNIFKKVSFFFFLNLEMKGLHSRSGLVSVTEELKFLFNFNYIK